MFLAVRLLGHWFWQNPSFRRWLNHGRLSGDFRLNAVFSNILETKNIYRHNRHLILLDDLSGCYQCTHKFIRSHFDLPIALGLMVAMDVVPRDAVEDALVLGELVLDGAIQLVSGVLLAAIAAAAASRDLICPHDCGNESLSLWLSWRSSACL
jgi:hypothetical protein